VHPSRRSKRSLQSTRCSRYEGPPTERSGGSGSVISALCDQVAYAVEASLCRSAADSTSVASARSRCSR
jgi:hypothetical protein